MADLMNDLQFLKFHYSSEDAMKDKDVLKNSTFEKYSDKVTALLAVPFFAQLWQIKLLGNVEKVALYNRVRVLKTASLFGAVAFGSYETSKLNKQFTYYNRFYPEPTELQRTLARDAFIFRENPYQETSVEERALAVEDPKLRQVYSQMYALPPQRNWDAEEDVNAPEHQEHH